MPSTAQTAVSGDWRVFHARLWIAGAVCATEGVQVAVVGDGTNTEVTSREAIVRQRVGAAPASAEDVATSEAVSLHHIITRVIADHAFVVTVGLEV